MSARPLKWVGSIRLTSLVIALTASLIFLDCISYIYMYIYFEDYERNMIHEQIISNTIALSYLAGLPIICGFLSNLMKTVLPSIKTPPVLGMIVLSGIFALALKPILLPVNLNSAIVALMIMVIAIILASTSAVVERIRLRGSRA
jgi:hypothetical protein